MMTARSTISAPRFGRVAILIPCRNEEKSIVAVVRSFAAVLPDARIYVYDNASKDRTSALAAQAGAVVREEPRPGKGGVVRRMFAEVDADVFVLVDGDGTYDAAKAEELVRALVDGHHDMVTAVRDDTGEAGAYRAGHRLGNRMFNLLVRWIFGESPRDMFSGYRAFSRRFVKSFPASARGFEIETEMTVHALQLRIPTAEVVTAYRARAEGSESKLNSYRDGLRILGFMMLLFKEVRPFAFFGIVSGAFTAIALILGTPVVAEFFETGLVPRLPTAVLATGFVLLGALSLSCGMILDSVGRGRLDAKRLAYLAQPGRNGLADPWTR